MSSKNFADKMIIFLDKYKHYSDRDKKVVHYGLETIYIFITKLLLITFISIIFKITKEMYIFISFYFFLRLFSSGVHLSTSLECTIFSTLIFIITPFLCKYTDINLHVKFFIFILTLIMFIIYSPADTHRKPIINKNKRKKLKIKSIITCIVYFVLLLFIKNKLILNSITYAFVVQSFFISPIAYKLFKQPYNNYKNYK